MSTVTGVVGWCGKNKFGKYSIKLEGNETWYGSQYEIKASKGDTVEFDDGDKKYCNKLKVLSGGPTEAPTGGSNVTRGNFNSKGVFPIPATDGQRSIIRQNAVTNANTFLQNNGSGAKKAYTVDDLLDVARQIESYTSGAGDVELSKQRVNDAFDPES